MPQRQPSPKQEGFLTNAPAVLLAAACAMAHLCLAWSTACQPSIATHLGVCAAHAG